jgi:acyl carrier protein
MTEAVMTPKEIETILIDAISEIQELNGRSVEPIDSDTKPLTDLGGFDSLNAFEVTGIISEKIGFEIDPEVFGISCKQKQPDKITIREVTQNISARLN